MFSRRTCCPRFRWELCHAWGRFSGGIGGRGWCVCGEILRAYYKRGSCVRFILLLVVLGVVVVVVGDVAVGGVGSDGGVFV